jgi:hypothetical protein
MPRLTQAQQIQQQQEVGLPRFDGQVRYAAFASLRRAASWVLALSVLTPLEHRGELRAQGGARWHSILSYQSLNVSAPRSRA